MNVEKLTRARAEHLVAQTTDPELLNQLSQHPNKHVGQKVRFKRLDEVGRRNATRVKYLGAMLVAIDEEVQAKAKLATDLAAFLEKASRAVE